jgi:hypothetical protein
VAVSPFRIPLKLERTRMAARAGVFFLAMVSPQQQAL